MEQDEPRAELYDFLYRDISRLSSYYAQIFEGRLASIEKTDSTQDTYEDNAKLSIKLVEGGTRISKQTLVASKQVIDPHDIATVEVLSRLVESAQANQNLKESKHGELILIKGAIVFIDQLIFEGARTAFEYQMDEYKRLPKKQIDRQVVAQNEITKKLLEKLTMPSAFLLQMDDGALASGIIKEAGMDEPIISYYVKHGTNGLSDVYLVGIKEQSTSVLAVQADHMFGVAQRIAEELSQLIIPKDTYRVTPIAIFRKL